jgi:hypothetical protein
MNAYNIHPDSITYQPKMRPRKDWGIGLRKGFKGWEMGAWGYGGYGELGWWREGGEEVEMEDA